jgi:hypothetical protein
MANASLMGIAANAHADSSSSHYNLPKVPWFMSAGHNGTMIPTFTPDIGTSATYYTNDEAAGSGYSYVSDKKYPFWPGDSGTGGFALQKPSMQEAVEFNYKISGGNGIWMPCPIFRSISYHWSNTTAFNSNFAPRRIGLVLKNWKTDEEKTWGYEGGRNAYNTATGSLYWNATLAKVQHVRDLGPDWFVYGVIFNFKSASTNSNQSPYSELVDFRLGYMNNMGAGTYRMLMTVNQSWADLKSMLSSGIVRYPNVL